MIARYRYKMDKCSYENFNGMYNSVNGNVWFFGKCFNTILEVIKILEDVPKEYNDYIEINGLTCFVNSATGQVWYNHKTYDNTEKAFRSLDNLLKNGSGKTSLKRTKSNTKLDYLAL